MSVAAYRAVARTAPAAAGGADALVREHAALVRRIAYHLLARLPASVDVDDLIQAGMIGLLEASRNFEEGHGASFSTFAGIRIRGAMLDELRRGDWTPRSVHRRAREAADAIRAVEARTGTDASDGEVAAQMGVTLAEYQKLVADVARAPVFNLDEGSEEAAQLPDDSDGPDRIAEREGFQQSLQDAIGELPEKEKLVMSLYYGDELNLKEIGAVLGVTESRVCQIHGSALARLRARMVDWRD